MGSRLKVPDNWRNCPNIGSQLVIGKIMPFKTPLSHQYANLVKEKIFTIESVFRYAEEQQMNLGLWVDLTFVDRYDKRDVENHDCLYIKLRLNDRPPSVRTIKHIVNTIKNFLRKNPNSIVGVHCTHGFNRTGFLIVSFMVEIHGWDVEEAIAEFARIRPPGIFKYPLLKALFNRYKINHVPEKVPFPAWYTKKRSLQKKKKVMK